MNKNTNAEISLERFASLVAAYGADAGRWPDDERGAAQALLAISQDARDLLDAARTLDLCLDVLPQPRPSARLEAAILGAAPVGVATAATAVTQPISGRGLAGLVSAWHEEIWRPVGVFGMAAALGIVLGLNVMGPLGAALAGTSGSSDEVLAYALPTYGDSESGQ